MPLSSEYEADHVLDLFLTSLGTIKEITHFLGVDETERGARSFFWGLNGRCTIICSQATPMTRFRDSESITTAQIVLGRLDFLFDLDSFLTIELSGCSPPQRLRTLNELWASYGTGEKLSQLQRIKNCLHIGSPKEQSEFLAILKRCEDIFTLESSENYSLDKLPLWKRRSEPSHASLSAARSLYNVLETSRRCSCHTYGAIFCIQTHRDSDLNEEYDFNLFLEMDKRWQEAHFHAVRKSQPIARGTIEDGVKSGKKKIAATGRKKVEFLCDPIKKIWKNFPTYRLKFLIENDILWKLQSEPSNLATDTTTNAITLQHFMTEESSKLTEKTKRILAVLLGYAVIHLLETPWLNSSWGPGNILFLRTSSGTPLKPYIQLQFGDDIENNAESAVIDSNSDEDFDPDDLISHPYPSLVALAAMLIELHLTRRLQTIAQANDLDYHDDMNDRAKYIATAVIFDKCKNDISEQTREAIDSCLDQNIGVDDNGNELDAHELRSVIYKDVVSRLEYDLEHTFSSISIETLDMEAQELDLARWGEPIVYKKAISKGHADNVPRAQTPSNGRKRSRQVSESPVLNTLDCLSNLKFFDDETSPSDISFVARDAYLSWKNSFRSVHDHFIGDNAGPVPVKIAILDTGIDKSHPDYEAQEERIRGAKSFIPDCHQNDDVFDGCGHGTHVAGLLLDFAPDAELYIAKISDLEPAKPATVAEAIDYAVNVWNVDVISMSFGFPSREVDGYELLNQSIRRAANKDVLLFAAASNNGANTKRAYPARHPDVICIHSTNANGAPSDFNPIPLQGDNLATVGEAIESAWPVHLCDREMNKLCVARKSGTSFATPIASGVASFLLQYARAKLLPEEAALLKQCHFMKAVLKAVSVRSQGYDYIAPSLHPDNVFGKREASLKARIRDAMKDV